MINVVDVAHHYGVRPVLRHVNFRVRRGEVVALMGPNGTGKSTLMGLIAGSLSPAKGYIEIDGKRRRRTAEEELSIRRQVVYLPADPWLPQARTGREWLLAVGRLYEIDDERLMDHVTRLLALFDLADKGDSPISSYSTGQKKKVALCGVLVTEAPVMLLDEPFACGLDPTGILALRRVLQHLSKRVDMTILMATPVPELVEELADRVAILHAGQITAYDSIEGLRTAAGSQGRLEEVYGKLANPRAMANIDRYFEGSAR